MMCIYATVVVEDILHELIVNWDYSGLHFVPVIAKWDSRLADSSNTVFSADPPEIFTKAWYIGDSEGVGKGTAGYLYEVGNTASRPRPQRAQEE